MEKYKYLRHFQHPDYATYALDSLADPFTYPATPLLNLNSTHLLDVIPSLDCLHLMEKGTVDGKYYEKNITYELIIEGGYTVLYNGAIAYSDLALIIANHPEIEQVEEIVDTP